MFRKLISSIFGPSVDYAQLVKDGAVILDVRTPQEFISGHIKESKNIPLQSIGSQVAKLKKDKVYITCCRSGVRSGNAKNILKSQGFEVYNGGGWHSLQSKI